jgi:TRAP-type mannitol/chloroaromatic compound transport system permease large subunit
MCCGEFASDAHFDANASASDDGCQHRSHRFRLHFSRDRRAGRFALGLATVTTLILAENYPLMVLLKETFTGIDSFPLMAVPFFILAAELMSGGSLTEVLLRFAGQFVGHRRGGLGYTNVVSLTFFSGISGSALADAAGRADAVKMMDKAGYGRSYAAALATRRRSSGRSFRPRSS